MDRSEPLSHGALIGQKIGVYRLDEEIGRGGMGAVYKASRVDGEFDQTVAIKLIKRGMDTDAILKRFRNERQILAALSHPNIAQFLGGGSTSDGLPYFVMEYIDGRPLYAYCDEGRLSIPERLKVFRQVCWAVEAAHQIKVIHRDLKPSNILVRKDGKPKLLDFGIAKVFDPELMATEMEPTAAEKRVMTPEYASPEQIGGQPVSAGSDVYSLGVILYELLTGQRPYALRRQRPDENSRIIREQQPVAPSACITRSDDLLNIASLYRDIDEILSTRGTVTIDELRGTLTGDLDKIVLKALRKEPDDRYRSARDFADDITNYLEHRPVKAEFSASMSGLPRPRTGGSVSIAVLPFATLAGSSSDSGEEYLGIGLADALISRLSGVSQLIVTPTSSVLPLSGRPSIDAGRTLGVDFVLDGNIRTIGSRVRVSVQLLSIADGAARWARAFDEPVADLLALEDKISDQVTESLLPHLDSEERKRMERRGTRNPAAHRAYLRGRYFVNRFTGEHLTKAVEAFDQAIELDPNYALPYVGLADFYVWSAIFGEMPSIPAFEKAERAARKAVEVDPLLGEAYAVLAFCVFLKDWDWGDAEYLVQRALELNPNHAFAHECLSNLYIARGRFDEGVAEIFRAEALDPLSPRAKLMSAWTLYQARRFDESVERARMAVQMVDEFPQGLLHLGNALVAAGKIDEAVEVLAKSVRLWPASAMPKYLLCHALAAAGRMDEAVALTAEVETTPDVKAYFAAMCCVATGQYDRAFDWFVKAVAERNEWLIWFGVEPKLDPVRNDPRFRQILVELNNPFVIGGAGKADASTDHETSIAVLPFNAVGSGSTDPGEQFLSIGLADAVTMRLSNVGRFLVRPTSSVIPFASRNADSFSAGRELGVEFVVDGIIRHVGDRVRVTVQLLDISLSGIRWAASFDESFTDVLELEDLIAERVTKSLLPRITGDEERRLAHRGTESAAAHEAYLQGRYFWNQFTPESFPKAITQFRKAIDEDPNYALAYAGVADFYTWACIYGIYSPAEGYPEVLAAATRALAIDDTLVEAHAALGLYYSNMQQWAEAEKQYRRAIELNRNYPLTHEWLSALLVGTGRFDEGRCEVTVAEQLDPLSIRPKVLTAWTICQMRDYAPALEKAEEIIHLDPDFWQGYLQAANCLIEMGEVEKALEYAGTAVNLGGSSPLPVYSMCFALAASGRRDEALQMAEQLERQAASVFISPYFIGMSLLAAGEIDRAFTAFEAAQNERSAWLIWWGTEPKLDPIRGDRRYWSILEATGNPIIGTLRPKSA